MKQDGPMAMVAFAFTLFLLVLCTVFWWERYKYLDCRKVGHSRGYCIGKVILR